MALKDFLLADIHKLQRSIFTR